MPNTAPEQTPAHVQVVNFGQWTSKTWMAQRFSGTVFDRNPQAGLLARALKRMDRGRPFFLPPMPPPPMGRT